MSHGGLRTAISARTVVLVALARGQPGALPLSALSRCLVGDGRVPVRTTKPGLALVRHPGEARPSEQLADGFALRRQFRAAKLPDPRNLHCEAHDGRRNDYPAGDPVAAGEQDDPEGETSGTRKRRDRGSPDLLIEVSVVRVCCRIAAGTSSSAAVRLSITRRRASPGVAAFSLPAGLRLWLPLASESQAQRFRIRPTEKIGVGWWRPAMPATA